MVIIPFKTVIRCFAISLIAGFAVCLVCIGSMPSAKRHAETYICKATPVRKAGTLESVAVSEGAEKSTISFNELNQENENE